MYVVFANATRSIVSDRGPKKFLVARGLEVRLFVDLSLEHDTGNSTIYLGEIPERKERTLLVPVRQVGHAYDIWRHHRSPPPQFRHGTGEEGNILQSPALVVSAVTTHNTFGPTDRFFNGTQTINNTILHCL
ncbi:hypothetical protein TNCV_4074631 [Trichonephila clavipes]|nr:hypothetical protein TNCV_4074631 [Trichonephila clavipes]